MTRWLYFIYGVSCHLLFLAVYTWFAGFVGNVLVPKSIDSPYAGPTSTAAAINLLLLGVFAAQHSIMARPAFKRVWTRVVPQPIERSTYVLMSCLALMLIMWQWRSIDAIVWNVESPNIRTAIWVIFAMGWLAVPSVTFLINHFDLSGTRQVWLHLRGKQYYDLPFRTPLLYKHVRHPLYVGFTIAFWATPTMTVGHLLLAVVLTGYMAAATLLEERDLIEHLGQQYEDYRSKVPRFFPRLKRRQQTSQTASVVSHS